jgi:large subunit ribosomal protein L1
MAKTKKELLEEAKSLGIEVSEKAKVAEIQQLIKDKAAGLKLEEETVSDTAPEEKSVAESADESQTETAKAGKRSAKALKEEAERQAKEERKAGSEEAPAKPKKPVKPARSRLERRTKGYRKSAQEIEKGKNYSLAQAVELAKKTSHVKFDATVELHINLNVDPKQADQNIRDTLVLPAGTGKSVKIAVFTDDVAAAKKAGADTAGSDELLALFDKGDIGFDVLIATPNLMSKLGKYARVLGPKGLMPNPKSGTVTTDVSKAVKEARAGRVEYRVDSTGIIHLGIGKASFTPAQLLENTQAVLDSIKANKPQSLKGVYIRKIYLTTSMGPSISIDLSGVG